MQIAARNGSVVLLELLNQNGGSLYSKGQRGDSLYQLAAQNGHLHVLKWLFKNGLEDLPDTTGNTAVHVAARRSESDILKYLDVNMGANFRLKNADGQTPYDCVPRFGDDPDKIGKCRDLVKSIVAEAERQEKEEQMAQVHRRASMSH
jgi:ankyrin repeat protein